MRTRSGYDVKVEVTGTEGSVATEANPTSFPLLRKDGHVGVGIATIEGWLDRFEETCEPQRDLVPDQLLSCCLAELPTIGGSGPEHCAGRIVLCPSRVSRVV